MTSIQNSLDDLERCQTAREMLLDCYLTAIGNVAHYAIDLDDEITAPHRHYLTVLAGELAVGAAGSPGREPRQASRPAPRLSRKGGEIPGHAKGRAGWHGGCPPGDTGPPRTDDSNHEAQLRTELGRLREISDSPGASVVSAAILAAADSIEQSIEQIRQQRQLMVSQFLVEIRMLHRRIDLLETPPRSTT